MPSYAQPIPKQPAPYVAPVPKQRAPFVAPIPRRPASPAPLKPQAPAAKIAPWKAPRTPETVKQLPPRPWNGFYDKFTAAGRSNAVESASAYAAAMLPGKNRNLSQALLRETAMVESDMGTNLNTGPDGPFQIGRIAFDATKDLKSHPKLTRKYKELQKRTGLWWPDVTYDKMRNPDYAALAARLYYSNKPAPLPTTVEGRARLWKSFYNSKHQKAKGTESVFRRKARRLKPFNRQGG